MMRNYINGNKLGILKHALWILLVVFASNSCRPSNEVSKSLLSLQSDTALFTAGGEVYKLLRFDEHGRLKLADHHITLSLDETAGGYDFTLKKNSKIYMLKKAIGGVSKVMFVDDLLLFTAYDFFSVDGANSGTAVVFNLKTGYVNEFPRALQNTCNPAILAGKIHLIDELKLIITDTSFNIEKTMPITYVNPDDPFSYLDTYAIHGLSKTKDGKYLAIEFTPGKSDVASKFYSGELVKPDRVISLRE